MIELYEVILDIALGIIGSIAIIIGFLLLAFTKYKTCGILILTSGIFVLCGAIYYKTIVVGIDKNRSGVRMTKENKEKINDTRDITTLENTISKQKEIIKKLIDHDETTLKIYSIFVIAVTVVVYSCGFFVGKLTY